MVSLRRNPDESMVSENQVQWIRPQALESFSMGRVRLDLVCVNAKPQTRVVSFCWKKVVLRGARDYKAELFQEYAEGVVLGGRS